MFNNPYYNSQASVDRINNQIAELEKMRNQLQQVQPTNLTQNFQIAPNNASIRYADSLEKVEKEFVIADTPFFSKDWSVLWLKNASGEIKTYELREIVKKDEKDLQIEFLQAQIEELKKGMIEDAEPDVANVNEPTESKKSSNVSNGRTSKTKSK